MRLRHTEAAPVKLLLTVDEAAQALCRGRSLIYELMARKEIFSVKIGRVRRIPLAALQAFIERQMTEGE